MGLGLGFQDVVHVLSFFCMTKIKLLIKESAFLGQCELSCAAEESGQKSSRDAMVTDAVQC